MYVTFLEQPADGLPAKVAGPYTSVACVDGALVAQPGNVEVAVVNEDGTWVVDGGECYAGWTIA